MASTGDLNALYADVVESHYGLAKSLKSAAGSEGWRPAMRRAFEATQSLFDHYADALSHSLTAPERAGFSANAALVADASLSPGTCRIPRALVMPLAGPIVIGILECTGWATTRRSARRLLAEDTFTARDALRRAITVPRLFLSTTSAAVVCQAEVWDAPAVAVDPQTARALDAEDVDVFALFGVDAVPQANSIAGEVQETSDRGEPPSGWLSAIMRGGDVAAQVSAAAVAGSSDPMRDEVLRAELGRFPPGERTQVQTSFDEELPEMEADPNDSDPEDVDPIAKYLDRSVDELELSVRTANLLQNANVHFIRDLVRLTAEELAALPRAGPKTVQQVEDILAELDLELGMDVSES
ncbi:MAG: DNA-directed RNA polymerase subunit alpha C-terminal domain-containing protein [Myxococcota bacterium]